MRVCRNKLWQSLFSWPEIGVFINGPTVKGFSEPGPVFRICRSLVGAAAIGCCEGSTMMFVQPHCGWCLSPAENVLWPERRKGRNVNVRQQSSPFGEVVDFFFTLSIFSKLCRCTSHAQRWQVLAATKLKIYQSI